VSSQFLTAVLMAVPLAEGEGATDIISEGLISQPYVEMTIKLMERFGVQVCLLCLHCLSPVTS
jgi:3-phosphoshikimate 1-carboxyvinyltransferase